jgi:mono/diheme cytochrome c family protein
MKVLRFLGLSLLALLAAVLVAYVVIVIVANRRYQKMWTVHSATFPIPFPLSDTELASLKRERAAAGAKADDPLAGVDLAAAARDSAIARGAHLVYSRVGCTGCHGPDFGGGVIVDIPVVGFWAAPNLTTGNGGITRDFTAREWDLAVRHGIRHTGRSSSMPAADLANLSDHELSDIVTFLRSMPAIDRTIPPVRFGPVFAMLTALDVTNALPAFKIDHQKPHAVEPPAAAPTPEFGEHIVQTCRGCHGDHLSGGKVPGDPNLPLVANITPDATGLRDWTEADFVRALREGKRPDGSAIAEAMPWKMYGQMTDTELKAVWAYLRTVPPLAKGNR